MAVVGAGLGAAYWFAVRTAFASVRHREEEGNREIAKDIVSLMPLPQQPTSNPQATPAPMKGDIIDGADIKKAGEARQVKIVGQNEEARPNAIHASSHPKIIQKDESVTVTVTAPATEPNRSL